MGPAGQSHAGHRLELFGGPEVRGPTEAPILLSPTQESLVTLVWGHGARGVTRRTAIGLLWEQEDGPKARHRLRQLLHEVALRVGFHVIEGEGDDTLRPDADALPSDLDDFAAALQARELGRALELERAGFASKLRRIPGEAFEDWLDAKRARLRRDLHAAAATQWDLHHENGAWPAARDAAEVLYALDPGEASLRRVLEARAATGHVGSAEAAFAEFARRLEPDEQPAPETLELIERIRQLGATRTFGSASQPGRLPLVGRQRHMEEALRVLDKVAGADAFEVLLIRGDAGVGKTRLFDEILREAHLKGFRCLEARPAELERHIPLNPLVDMVSHPDVAPYLRALDDPWRAVVASLLPTLPEGMDPPVVPYIAETSLSRRLFDAFTFLLAGISADQPTLLFIDDLQWADDTTIAVLQFAQRRWRGGAIGVVATVRDDLVKSGQAVAGYLTETRDLPITSLEVQDLTEAEAVHLVDLVAEGELDRDMCARLCALGGRTPFYLVELTRDYVAGKVQLPALPSDALFIPISLRQLVAPRLDGLTPEAASAAAHLAVWGRSVPLPDLTTVLEATLDACTGYVEELERNRLVLVERGAVGIAHQLFRGALYHGMTHARQALLHRSIAEHLATTEQPQPGELAVHFAHAGEDSRAARHGRAAADAALENGAMAEAAFFLQLVLDNEGDEHLKAEATGDLARVLHLNREILRANPLLELAATRLRAVGDHARALRMDIRRVEGLAEVGSAPISELLDRLAVIKRTARDAGDDEAWAFALDQELLLLHRSGRMGEIQELFNEVRQCAESENSTARCQANACLALSAVFGVGLGGLGPAREAVRIAEQEGLRDHTLLAMHRLFVVLLNRGLSKTPEATALLAKASEEARRSGDVVLRFSLRQNQGVAHLDAGELEEAALALEEAGAIITNAEASVRRISHFVNLGELAFDSGDLEGALANFSRVEDLLVGATTPTDAAQLVNAGIGLCHLEMGAITQARQRESLLQPLPEFWTFDPNLVLAFRTRLMERRGEIENALAFISAQRQAIEERFPTAWMRTLPLEARLAKKLGRPNWRDIVEDAIAVADRLGYSVRAAEFRAML